MCMSLSPSGRQRNASGPAETRFGHAHELINPLMLFDKMVEVAADATNIVDNIAARLE